ncbi:hypothetical protein LTR85_006487 [Meristemomyces frigidus]|nr:hypothetical protein LTR85_006487 [Meristemomyces frigidus]
MTTITAPTTKRASYVPQNAAKHFAATTTPMSTEASADLKRARSTKERIKPDFHPESMPTVNPKQLTAALSLGMSESEVGAAAAAAEPGAEPKGAPAHLTVPAAHKTRANRQSRVVRTATEENRLRSKARSQSPDADEQVHPMSSYKPGDAAKRAADRRKSQIMPSHGRLITVDHGATTTQHREYTLEFSDPKRTEIPDAFDFAIAEDDAHHTDSHHHSHHFDSQQQHHVVHRPALKPHDRHNWAQESQAGDEMRHHLHRPHFGRRKSSSKTAADREDARQALEGGSSGSNSQRPSGPARHKSADTLPDTQALVSDAVRLIKKEEKAKRRQSIVGFFKRL